jgi:hypothetical protein
MRPINRKKIYKCVKTTSVPDPDADPDPRFRTSDQDADSDPYQNLQ